MIHVVCRRLQLDDPSSAPQLGIFKGTFHLATNGSSSDSGPGPMEKVRLALDGYAQQGDAKELAQELLKEDNLGQIFFEVTEIGMMGWIFGKMRGILERDQEELLVTRKCLR